MRDTMDELFDNEKLPTKPPLSKIKQFMFILMLLAANILLVTYAVFPYAILLNTTNLTYHRECF